MTEEPTVRWVEVSFVGRPPARALELTQGVSEVRVNGPVLSCLVCGSFQPFLEALRGHEVIRFESTQEPRP